MLKVHATLAKILHASGADESIDKNLRDPAMTGVLAKDGTNDIVGIMMLAMTSIGVLGSRVGNIQERKNSTSTDENTKPALDPTYNRKPHSRICRERT